MKNRVAFRFIMLFFGLMLFISLTLSVQAATSVPCNVPALISAITSASSGDTLDLAAGCTYTLTAVNNATDDGNGLPVIGITLTINGNGATIERGSAAPDFRLLDIADGKNLTLNNLTLSNGSSTGSSAGGGAIYVNDNATLTINNSIIAGNSTSGSGGAIYNHGGTLNISNSTISGNQAFNAGAIQSDSGAVTLVNSTLANNSASNTAGGIYNNLSTVTIINSTLADNVSLSDGVLLNLNQNGIVKIINSTIVNNTTTSGSAIENLGTATLQNSIVANNSPGNCLGTITDGGHNLDSGTTCGFSVSSLSNTDPLLDPLGLQNNGGLTQTIKLLTGSPAIDAGDNALAVDETNASLAYDQRGTGYARILNATVDLGAYEAAATVVVTEEPTQEVTEAPTEEPPAEPTPVPSNAAQPISAPVTALCSEIEKLSNGAITASGGVQNVRSGTSYGNTYCRLIAYDRNYVTSPAEIGVQSVISLGVVDAVDVFGELPNGASVVPFITPVTVCLRGSGDVLFLSAADASRTPQHLEATANAGFLCVSVPNSGTVVLVASPSNIPTQPPTANNAAPTTLNNCRVTTTHAPLNLRAEPNTSASVMAQLPYDLTLSASEHLPGWYRVIYLDGQGWISADFVTTVGECG